MGGDALTQVMTNTLRPVVNEWLAIASTQQWFKDLMKEKEKENAIRSRSLR